MEIVNIEAHTFEAMMNRFEALTQRVETICKDYKGNERKKWLDSQDVCVILNVSKRKLQYLRDKGELGYTMIAHKVFYRPEDVQGMIERFSKEKEVSHE
ncbi:MAG: helix-turn-helix domain-containing protein [Prevotellaceae bacterium]|jgi:hypothetical protein|nr:helix-turn-helix domain-containing protein [Prevotellaceae bacterium]